MTKELHSKHEVLKEASIFMINYFLKDFFEEKIKWLSTFLTL